MKLAQISTKYKVSVVLGLLIVIWAGWYTMYTSSDHYAPRAFHNLSEGTVQLVNDEGETVTASVKIAETSDERNVDFARSGSDTVENNIIYYIHPRNVVDRVRIYEIKTPVDVGFFNADGQLVHLSQAQVGETTSHRPEAGVRYRYILKTHKGYFEENNISVDGESKLLPDTLQRK